MSVDSDVISQQQASASSWASLRQEERLSEVLREINAHITRIKSRNDAAETRRMIDFVDTRSAAICQLFAEASCLKAAVDFFEKLTEAETSKLVLQAGTSTQLESIRAMAPIVKTGRVSEGCFRRLYDQIEVAGRTAASSKLFAANWPYSESSRSIAMDEAVSSIAGPFNFLIELQSSHFDESVSVRPKYLAVVDAIAGPVLARLDHHFGHDPPDDSNNEQKNADANSNEEGDAASASTINRIDRPDWFYSHVKTILSEPLRLLDFAIQPMVDKAFKGNIDCRPYFISRIVQFARMRARSQLPLILADDYLLSRHIDQALEFDDYLHDHHLYGELCRDHHFAKFKQSVVSAFADNPARLTKWVKLEAKVRERFVAVVFFFFC